MNSRIKKYKKGYDYSYALGAAPTVELIEHMPQKIRKIYFHPDYRPAAGSEDLRSLCEEKALPFEINEKLFDRLSQKENIYVIGVFDIYMSKLINDAPHIVLVNPADSGNLGTIMRTALGYDFCDIAVINPGADCFDPKAVRASMGALFQVRIRYYNSIDEYMESFPTHMLYSFMLKGILDLKGISKVQRPYSLVFGNEATGLDDSYLSHGESVYISHGNKIDSLNLAVAFGIAADKFYSM